LGINDRGQVVGVSGSHHAFLFENGVVVDLGTLPGGTVSRATAINNRGQIAGESTTASGDMHLFDDGVMTDLGTLPGGTSSNAAAINDSGQVVGSSSTANSFSHAFLFDDGVMIDLGTLPGGNFSGATGINNHGQVVGSSSSATSAFSHATLWTPAHQQSGPEEGRHQIDRDEGAQQQDSLSCSADVAGF
jgi:probable HAF family extracellular repeat protein